MGNNCGVVFWITGLSGSGKTTIGTALTKRLREDKQSVIFLDGDSLREMVGNIFGHTREERLKASLFYARLCQEIAMQGTHVVCSTVSLFYETQQWNRNNMPHYLEIFIDVPLTELQQRDPKKIYENATRGLLKNVVGIDIIPDFPTTPDLIISNHNGNQIDNAINLILQLFNNRFCTLV